MANSSKVPLLVCTFQTLLKFLNWIPLGYIFETQLVKTLVYKFLPQPAFRNDVLACLTEIGSLDIGTIYERCERLLIVVASPSPPPHSPPMARVPASERARSGCRPTAWGCRSSGVRPGAPPR